MKETISNSSTEGKPGQELHVWGKNEKKKEEVVRGILAGK